MRFLRPAFHSRQMNLEGGIGLAGAGRHDEQDAVAAFGDGLNRSVNGVDLVVAWGFAAAVVEIVLKYDLLGLGVEALPLGIARPEIGRRRESIQCQSRLGCDPCASA